MPEAHPMELPWRDEEKAALERLSREKRMSEFGILRQALRLYHQHEQRLSDGETCTWSGDEKRVLEFVGPDFNKQ